MIFVVEFHSVISDPFVKEEKAHVVAVPIRKNYETELLCSYQPSCAHKLRKKPNFSCLAIVDEQWRKTYFNLFTICAQGDYQNVSSSLLNIYKLGFAGVNLNFYILYFF